MPPADPPSLADFAAHTHDSLVQRFLTRPEIAAVQLRVALPPALTTRFDWPILRIASGTYIDPKLRPRRGDILYAVDPEQLQRWFDRALCAVRIEDVFGE